MTRIISDEAVYRTAPATPGLVIKAGYFIIFQLKDSKKNIMSYVLQNESRKSLTFRKLILN